MKAHHNKEINLEDVSAYDELVIRTENSKYRFSVIDPAQKFGTLSGGSLGDQPYSAIFLGGVIKNDSSGTFNQRLRTEMRAIFTICTPKGLEQLLTSVVTELTHIRTEVKEFEPA